ncbi:hypothetical protein ABZV75_05660 [Streptomyces flaveolus]|uniref:hypothetical protein n=1 Tax=Streptomyces flaveolus TaxID=67297 RepID=UPI0033B99914
MRRSRLPASPAGVPLSDLAGSAWSRWLLLSLGVCAFTDRSAHPDGEQEGQEMRLHRGTTLSHVPERRLCRLEGG